MQEARLGIPHSRFADASETSQEHEAPELQAASQGVEI